MARDTTPTNRRAYERPEIGDDWAQAWDDLVEDLDSASLYVDSTENTSATDPIPGTTHFEDVDAGSVNTVNKLNGVVTIDETYGGNSEIGAAWNQARADFDGRVWRIKPGEYTATTPLDFTDMDTSPGRKPKINLLGVTINAETGGSPVIDATSTRHGQIYGGEIIGQSTNTPNVGILNARADEFDNCGQWKYWGTIVRGSYTESCMYNYGSEENDHYGIQLKNDSGPNFIHTSENARGVSSVYKSIATASLSTNGVKIDGGRLFSNPNDASSGNYVGEGSVSDVRFDKVFMACDGDAHITFDATGGSVNSPVVNQVRFHGTGNGLPTHNIEFIGSNNIIAPTITDCHLEATGRVVKFDTTINQVTGAVTYTGNTYFAGDAPQFYDLPGGSKIVHDPSRTFKLTDPVATIEGTFGPYATLIGDNISINNGVNRPNYQMQGTDWRIDIGPNGSAIFYDNANGEVVVEDDAANTTTIS